MTVGVFLASIGIFLIAVGLTGRTAIWLMQRFLP